jgi:hypothetical protein
MEQISTKLKNCELAGAMNDKENFYEFDIIALERNIYMIDISYRVTTGGCNYIHILEN